MSIQTDRRETSVEKRFVDLVEQDDPDVLCLKYGVHGFPDRLVCLHNSFTFWIEFKKKGKGPRRLQVYQQNKLKRLGYAVYNCDTYQEAFELYRKHKKEAERLSKNSR